MSFNTINPHNGEILSEYEEFNDSLIEEKIESSYNAFEKWRKTTFKERSVLILKAANILEASKTDLAKMMALEMGKPIRQGIAEVKKCAWCCRYFAENAEQQLADMNIETGITKSYVAFQPLGVILAVMPWNFPFWQVFRFAAPNLMAGNTGILKHSRNTMGCAVLIESIFKEAGFPENVFTNLIIGSNPVKKIIEHPLIAAVTLTGSTPVGQEVASISGKVLKKCVMELGGSDPYIILEDADLETAVETCVNARLINSGQSCIAAKRFIVVESILDKFERLFLSVMSSRKMGNPLDENVDVGPQARKDLQKEIHRQVEESILNGAKIMFGGYFLDTRGNYYPPTILSNVRSGMPAYNEEIFGPVASIIPVKDESEAIKTANDTIFGLGAAIFTKDLEKAEYLAKYEIQAGTCFINDSVRSDPRLPFGGIKYSGFGRELSIFGIREFVNIKTICIK